jgi:hypothetical protein
MIIPIGVDCGIADFLRKYNLRNSSFPFDWTISYNGVSDCIEDEFKLFIEPLNDCRINEYDICFHHDFYNSELLNQDKEKYNRRCKRLKNILETSDEPIIFCRKGHSRHHHNEHNEKYSNIRNDIVDAEKLSTILNRKYPQLKFKIIVILVCGKCFNPNEIYKSISNNIEIYNIATPEFDNEKFEKQCRKIFLV